MCAGNQQRPAMLRATAMCGTAPAWALHVTQRRWCASNSNQSGHPSSPIPCGVLRAPTVYQGSAPLAWEAGRLAAINKPLMTRVYSFGMPRGFPLSCAPGYARFFYAYVSHAFISNFAMSIATQALLGGFFAESTPQIWMIKDLAPSVIAAYLANRVASYELRPVYWLIVSVALSQAATIVDLFIPLFVGPKYLLAAAIASAVVKHNAVLMHFVARASVLQHFAIYQNLGEVQKKLNSFGMITFTLATALGIAFTSVFPSFAVQSATVVASSAASIGLAYYSLSHIAFRGLTPLTGQLLAEAYVQSNFAKVRSLEDVRQTLGMSAVLKNNAYVEKCYACNPKLSNVSLDAEGTLVAGDGLCFTIGLWAVRSGSGNGAASASLLERTFGAAGKKLSGALGQKQKEEGGAEGNSSNPQRRRLVLLVHRKCPPSQLFLAHLLCYSALNAPKALAAASALGLDGATTTNADDGAAWEAAIRSFFSPVLAGALQGMRLTAELEAVALQLEAAVLAAKHSPKQAQPNGAEATSEAPSAAEGSSSDPSDRAAWTRANDHALETAEGHEAATLWLRRTAVFVELLREEGWDVVTPSLDPIEGRISTVPEAEDY